MSSAGGNSVWWWADLAAVAVLTTICFYFYATAQDHRGRFKGVICGPARVIDGDTIVVDGKKIRLSGIDAPEALQRCEDADRRAYRCGAVSTSWLKRNVGGEEVVCQYQKKDRYGRYIGVCWVSGRAESLNSQLVRAGLALAYENYSTQFVEQQTAARAAKRGLWAGSFMAPWDWRKIHGRRGSKK